MAYTACMVGGYGLNYCLTAAHKLAAKYVSFPFRHPTGQEYNEMVKTNLENMKATHGTNVDGAIGVILLRNSVVDPIREEVVYRLFIETIVLPYIIPEFASISIARTCVSSFLFALAHLGNKEPLTPSVFYQFYRALIVGAVFSIAQHKIGLLGAIFTHIGFNLEAHKWGYNHDGPAVRRTIDAIPLDYLISLGKYAINPDGFKQLVLAPFIQAYRIEKMAKESY